MQINIVTAQSSMTLDQVKDKKIVELAVKFQATLASGFASTSSDGTVRYYPLDPTSMLKWSGAMSIIDTNAVTSPLIIKDITGSQISVTPDQFKQLATDGFTFFMQQEQKLWGLEAKVEECIDIPSVNAITWEGN